MIKKLASPFREFGYPVGLYYLIDTAFSRISSKLRLLSYDFLVQPISEKPLGPRTLVKDLEIREIERGDPELERMPAQADIIQSRFNQNAICLAAFQKGIAIAYMWLCFRSYQEDEVRCNFVLSPPEASVFDFDFYIYPEHRFGIAFLGLWYGANEYLKERGIKYSFSRLTRTNIASEKAHKHLGIRRVGRALFLKLGDIEMMFSSISPRFHLSLRRDNRVNIQLNPQVPNDKNAP